MSDASDNLENDLMLLLFNATNWANVADNAASSPVTVWYLSLHTSTGPGEAGNQTTNAAAYTSYARTGVNRNSGGWSVTGGVVSPVANIDFAAATGGSETETYFGWGNSSSGSGRLQGFGAISPTIAVTTGTTPRLTTATTITMS